MHIFSWLATLFVSMLPALAFAQLGPTREAPLPTIGIKADTTDDTGMEVLSQLREAIKRAGYFPSTNATEALVGVHFLSLDARADQRGQQTLYSVAWTGRDGRFVTHTVATCTLRSAAECANQLMVTTSQVAQMQQVQEAASRSPR